MTERTCKYLTIFMFFSIFLTVKPCYCQKKYRYSIDIENVKSRRVPAKFWIQDKRESLGEGRDWRKNKRIEERDSKKTKKHAYKIQKKYVQKRMKETRKHAKWHNQNKLPFIVKLKKRRNGKHI